MDTEGKIRVVPEETDTLPSAACAVSGTNPASARPPCPMVDFVNLVSGKWAIPILYRLIMEGAPIRFMELQRAVAPITQKELTKQLRLFERRGLVERTIYAEVPPRVEYTATPLARSLRGTLDSLASWMTANSAVLQTVTMENDETHATAP